MVRIPQGFGVLSVVGLGPKICLMIAAARKTKIAEIIQPPNFRLAPTKTAPNNAEQHPSLTIEVTRIVKKAQSAID